VEQLDVECLPVEVARYSIEDASRSLTAINMELAMKLEHVGSALSHNEDAWKNAALAAQSKTLEQQRVIADLNKRVLELSEALEKCALQSTQISSQVCSSF
jgi:hypothetical protein